MKNIGFEIFVPLSVLCVFVHLSCFMSESANWHAIAFADEGVGIHGAVIESVVSLKL